eukprot:3889855-Ditylum_brightwellii.AAC.2
MSGWSEQEQWFLSRMNPTTPRFLTPPTDLTRFSEIQYQDPRSGYVDSSSNSLHKSANSHPVQINWFAQQTAGASNWFAQQMAGAS